MNSALLIQEKLDSIRSRWRWNRFGLYLGLAGAVFCLLWLGLEFSAWYQFLTNAPLFYFLAGILVFGGIVALLGLVVVAFILEPPRAWLAAQLEKGCPGLLDRVNTVVFLERSLRPGSLAFRKKIEQQATQVFQEQPVVSPLSPRSPLYGLGAFALLLALVIGFDLRYAPFFALLHPPVAALKAGKKESLFELTPTSVTETQQDKKPWGEVRIVDPARDVRLTKIDVLPLQIEMTASAPLQAPLWMTSINGAPETPHLLLPPTEPQYAVYQPLVYLDELNVSDWDVVSYYAKAETSDHNGYASKIYFIDIRPFREDIEKETGGKTAKGNKIRGLLNEINGLVTQQTVVLQQSHDYQQTTYPTPVLRKQDNVKLTDAEGQLVDATGHLYGKMAAEDENAPIGIILDHLASAQAHMTQATDALREDVVAEGKQREQAALADLIATRKAFLKMIGENPDAFADADSDPTADDDDTPTAKGKKSPQDSLKKLSQVTEMKNREQAGIQALHQLAQRQRYFARMAEARSDAAGAVTPQEENNLKQNLDRLVRNEPELFRTADAEIAAADQDTAQAVNELTAGSNYQAKSTLSHAADDLSDLEKAVRRNQAREQVAQAYQLKKIIDQNIQQLNEEKTKPGSMSDADAQAVADSAQRSTSALKDATEGQGNLPFGHDLKDALSPANQQALQQSLGQMTHSPAGQAGRTTGAGSAQANLEQVSKAFDQGLPTLTAQARGGKSGQGQGQGDGEGGQGMDEAMQQLQGLILAKAAKRSLSDEQQNKAKADVLFHLQDALAQDKTAAGVALLAQAQATLSKKTNAPADLDELKKLLDAVQTLSADASEKPKDQPGAEITLVDPSKFPATYRDRIRAYYEQLSAHHP